MNTSELTGPALAWAVAMADKRQVRHSIGGSIEVHGRSEAGDELPKEYDLWMFWYPQASWTQAGPIIEREGITIVRRTLHEGITDWWATTEFSNLHTDYGPSGMSASTPLIAAMRCYVASKLGYTVEIPEELV